MVIPVTLPGDIYSSAAPTMEVTTAHHVKVQQPTLEQRTALLRSHVIGVTTSVAGKLCQKYLSTSKNGKESLKRESRKKIHQAIHYFNL
jgi:hypothetical protein